MLDRILRDQALGAFCSIDSQPVCPGAKRMGLSYRLSARASRTQSIRLARIVIDKDNNHSTVQQESPILMLLSHTHPTSTVSYNMTFHT